MSSPEGGSSKAKPAGDSSKSSKHKKKDDPDTSSKKRRKDEPTVETTVELDTKSKKPKKPKSDHAEDNESRPNGHAASDKTSKKNGEQSDKPDKSEKSEKLPKPEHAKAEKSIDKTADKVGKPERPTKPEKTDKSTEKPAKQPEKPSKSEKTSSKDTEGKSTKKRNKEDEDAEPFKAKAAKPLIAHEESEEEEEEEFQDAEENGEETEEDVSSSTMEQIVAQVPKSKGVSSKSSKTDLKASNQEKSHEKNGKSTGKKANEETDSSDSPCAPPSKSSDETAPSAVKPSKPEQEVAAPSKPAKSGLLSRLFGKSGSKDKPQGPGERPVSKEVTPTDKKKEDEKQTYIVSSVADLPEDIQKKLKKAHLEEAQLNAHFAVLCNVLHFLTKDCFQIPDQEKEVRERRPYASPELMSEAKKIIDSNAETLKKSYKGIEFSGKGGFGRVFAARDTSTKKRVAIKKLPHATDKDKKNNYCEIGFLSTCNHPNIVKFVKCWEVPEKQEAWIVTEFLEGGTLAEAVKVHQFSDRHIAYVAREILKALKYLHSMGYVHRDLKSGNVMMSIEGHIKLIDFGLCCDIIEGPRLQMLGSPFWIPPEMIKKQKHGCPADIWSFAVCVLEMYLKEPPNGESRLFAMFTAATAGLKYTIPARASEQAHDFLSHCLEINPKKRWTAEQLLEHPFVTQPKLEDGIREVLRGVFVSNSLAMSGI